MLDGPIGNDDSPADGLDKRRTRDFRSATGRSFDQHVRSKSLDQQLGSVLVEDQHVVDASQCPQHLGSFVNGGSSGGGSSEYDSSEYGSTNGDSALTSDISLTGGGGGGGGGVLASLGSGGGGVSDGCSLVGGGTVEPGSVSLLPGPGGASLETGPGVLGTLGCGESLVGGGGGGVLVPLGSGGGVVEIGDGVSLGGTVD